MENFPTSICKNQIMVCSQQKVLCNWGTTLKQSSAVHIQALVSADEILLGSSSKLRLLVINLVQLRADSWSIPHCTKPRTLAEILQKHYLCRSLKNFF